MIPEKFTVNVAGDKTKPVAIKITVGPLVFMIAMALALVGVAAIMKKARK